MPILEISVIPLGTNNPSFGNIVSDACKTIDGKTLDYKITPTSTVIEGSLDDLFNVAKKMHTAPFSSGVDRVITSIKLDERHDKPTDMHEMIKEVAQNMQ